MQRYVVTGMDESYWSRWGLSWIVSLKEMAHYTGNILVVDLGLSPATKAKLVQLGATTTPPQAGTDPRLLVYKYVAELASGEPGIYACWDADVYFQKNIDEIFDLASDSLCVASRNAGFLAGPSHRWPAVTNIMNVVRFLDGGVQGQVVYDVLTRHFKAFTRTVDDGWNYVNIPSLKEGEHLTAEGRVVPVVHPSGPIKKFLSNRHVLFWERHPVLLEQYAPSRRKESRKLVMRSKHECTPE
jgi:hypothetical protein